LAVAICVPAACLLTAEGPLSQALKSAKAEIPRARVAPAFNPIIFKPAITVSPKQPRFGTKKEQLSAVVESNLSDLSSAPIWHKSHARRRRGEGLG
jgi:hypothetical protein